MVTESHRLAFRHCLLYIFLTLPHSQETAVTHFSDKERGLDVKQLAPSHHTSNKRGCIMLSASTRPCFFHFHTSVSSVTIPLLKKHELRELKAPRYLVVLTHTWVFMSVKVIKIVRETVPVIQIFLFVK